MHPNASRTHYDLRLPKVGFSIYELNALNAGTRILTKRGNGGPIFAGPQLSCQQRPSQRPSWGSTWLQRFLVRNGLLGGLLGVLLGSKRLGSGAFLAAAGSWRPSSGLDFSANLAFLAAGFLAAFLGLDCNGFLAATGVALSASSVLSPNHECIKQRESICLYGIARTSGKTPTFHHEILELIFC